MFCSSIFLNPLVYNEIMKKMSYIAIGKAINTHGLKGEIKIQSWSDFDDERYRVDNTLWLWHNETYTAVKVATYRRHKNFVLASFAEYQDINLIEKFKGCLICIEEKERKPLPAGTYYRTDMIGLRAEDEDNHVLGTIIDVEETNGAQHNLRLKKEDGKTCLIPNIPQFVKQIDVKAGRIVIAVVKGLL